MVRRKDPYPSKGDFVICTITKVEPHGAFCKLDEYGGKEGYIHISEVASTWIRNIRDFVKEGQKVVAKVLEVNPKKGHIDLSIRRVTQSQRKQKIQEWKRAQKAEKLLEIMAKELGATLDEAYQKVGFKLEEKFGEIYDGFEEIVEFGEKALKGLRIPKKWKDVLIKVVKENVTLPEVKISGYFELRCSKSNGVEVIKDTLIKAKNLSLDGAKIDIFYVGAPKYKVVIKAQDYKTAEEALKKVTDFVLDYIKKNGGEGKFVRVK